MSRMRRVVVAVCLTPLAASAQLAPNLGFENGRAAADGRLRPVGWDANGVGYEIVLDSAQRMEGRTSLRSRRVDTTAYDQNAGRFGAAGQRIPVYLAAGRTLRFTGWIRTENITDGYAGLWMRVDAGAQTAVAFDNMGARGARGTTPWTRYVIELPVDSAATAIVFGVLHPGTGTAWFDSLHVEVFGPALPRRVAAPPPPPADDLTRLLSDAELAVPRDSAAPAVDTAWAEWVRANARPIRSLGATDYSDLDFLRPLVAGKRIVQLGESGHGVREFTMAKVRLIKYLHEKLGYDVIAFESSLFACDRTGRRAATLSALELMRGCIFGVWHVEEVLPLFEYVRETQRTSRPLVLTGFDVQVSTNAVDRERPEFLSRVVAAADTAYARRVRETDAAFLGRRRAAAAGDLSTADRDRYVAFYDSLAAWIRAREATLASSFRDDPAAPALARQVAVSMVWEARHSALSVGDERLALRDRGMADNLDFVLDELHPGKRVMVWAHNFHIQHRGFAPDTTPTVPVRSTGTYMAERHRRELYTIGLYMYRGSAAGNTRAVYPVARAAPNGLEAILHRAPWKYAFVDLSRAPAGPGTSWMTRRIPSLTWGTTLEQLVPREEYDGIVFIDTTWPPAYITGR